MKQFLFIVLTLCFFYSISQKIVDGATLLNRGLDFRQGGLVPEERLRSPLFDFTIDNSRLWSPPTRPDLKFVVPKEVYITSLPRHDEQTSSDLFMSYTHVIIAEASGFSFSININVGVFGFGFGYSREYGRIYERLNSTFRASTRGIYKTSVYKCMTPPPFVLKLNNIFQQSLEMLPVTPEPKDMELYKVVLQYYGGFYMYEGTFGGLIRDFHFITEELIRERDHTWIRTQISFSFHYKLFSISAGGFRRREDIRIDERFKKGVISEYLFTGGHRHLQRNETLKEWDRSIDEAQSMLDAKFHPISIFITNSPIKKKNLETIIKVYSESGKIEVPKSSSLVQNKKRVPGYQVVGSGYDSASLQVRESIFEPQDDVFTSMDSEYAIPASVHYKSVPKEVVIQEKSLDKSEFEIQWSKRRVGTYETGFGRKTREYHQFSSKFNNEKQIRLYQLTLEKRVLNPLFQAMIDNIKDIESCKKIIEMFGTHYVESVIVGGMIISEDLSKCQIVDHSNKDCIFIGGIQSQEFTKSILKQPEVIESKIVSILDLVKQNEKKEMLKKTIQEYLLN